MLRLNKKSVLVIGDVMLDKWVYLKALRTSPEANVPIVHAAREFSELGGAGNALRHLSNLSDGAHELVGVVGDDSIGRELTLLSQSESSAIHLIVDPKRKSTLKMRFFLEDLPIFRHDIETIDDLEENIEIELFSQVKKSMPGKNAVLISDYAKGVLTKNLISDIISLARELEIPTISDPGLGRIEFHAGCEVIKPNNREWNLYIKEMGSEQEAFLFLFSRGTKFVVITQGDKGIRIVGREMDVFGTAESVGNLADVTGAGDSVAAILSLLTGAHGLVPEHLPVLNKIGAKTVSAMRTELPKIAELQEIRELKAFFQGTND